MSRRSLSKLKSRELLTGLDEAESRQRRGDADVLAYLAEAESRRLYAKLGYPSMYMWCLEARHYSEDVAAKRIRAARAARRYPVILDMLADGRLHLTAIALLSHRLTPANAQELLAAAVHRSKREIQAMLAERFPQPDVPTVVQAVPATNSLPAPAPVNNWAEAAVSAVDAAVAAAREAVGAAPTAGTAVTPAATAAPAKAPEKAQATATPPPAYSRVTPTAPQRYAVQFTMDQAMHADLLRIQELLGPQADDDRVRAVFRRALRDLVTTLEKRKLAATDRPRATDANGKKTRAQVKREVRQRDGDRCAWVSEAGKRCAETRHLQFDHIEPRGKGGEWTTENVRLLCPAHNQLEADREYGEGHMHGVRQRQREATERRRRPRVPVVPAVPGPVASAAPVASPLPDPLSCAPAQAATTAPPCP
jgi:5-methylcytosine-specific restriction endonuclease McrA